MLRSPHSGFSIASLRNNINYSEQCLPLFRNNIYLSPFPNDWYSTNALSHFYKDFRDVLHTLIIFHVFKFRFPVLKFLHSPLTILSFHAIIHLTIKLIVKYISGGVLMGLQQTLKALADPTRREILNLLKSGKKSAGEITAHFDISAAAISRHLSVLKDADLVYDSRDGKFIYYTLNTSVLEETLLWITDLKGE